MDCLDIFPVIAFYDPEKEDHNNPDDRIHDFFEGVEEFRSVNPGTTTLRRALGLYPSGTQWIIAKYTDPAIERRLTAEQISHGSDLMVTRFEDLWPNRLRSHWVPKLSEVTVQDILDWYEWSGKELALSYSAEWGNPARAALGALFEESEAFFGDYRDGRPLYFWLTKVDEEWGRKVEGRLPSYQIHEWYLREQQTWIPRVTEMREAQAEEASAMKVLDKLFEDQEQRWKAQADSRVSAYTAKNGVKIYPTLDLYGPTLEETWHRLNHLGRLELRDFAAFLGGIAHPDWAFAFLGIVDHSQITGVSGGHRFFAENSTRTPLEILSDPNSKRDWLMLLFGLIPQGFQRVPEYEHSCKFYSSNWERALTNYWVPFFRDLYKGEGGEEMSDSDAVLRVRGAQGPAVPIREESQEPTDKNLPVVRIESDGTPGGTKVYDKATGSEISCVSRISFSLDAGDSTSCALIETAASELLYEGSAEIVARGEKIHELYAALIDFQSLAADLLLDETLLSREGKERLYQQLLVANSLLT